MQRSRRSLSREFCFRALFDLPLPVSHWLPFRGRNKRIHRQRIHPFWCVSNSWTVSKNYVPFVGGSTKLVTRSTFCPRTTDDGSNLRQTKKQGLQQPRLLTNPMRFPNHQVRRAGVSNHDGLLIYLPFRMPRTLLWFVNLNSGA